MKPIGYRIVTTTVGNEQQAVKLAHAIVSGRLAACVQFWPIRSTYRWQGRIESEQEYGLSCKTPGGRVKALISFIEAHHSYEVPEIIVTPIESGHPPYLQWIDRETTQPRLTFPASPTRNKGSRKSGKT